MTKNISIELGIDKGNMSIDFSIEGGPVDPTGHVKKQHAAKAAMGKYCFECPNSLLCISGHVAVQRCNSCSRIYIDGSMIPLEVRCKGFAKQPQTYVPHCVACAEEYVRSRLLEGTESLIGRQLDSQTFAQMKANLKAVARRLLEEKGWHINVDVVMDD